MKHAVVLGPHEAALVDAPDLTPFQNWIVVNHCC